MANESPENDTRILVVDDDPVVRVLAGRALSALGCEVEEATDGQQALEAIDRSPPDLVLLDVEMPGISGFETCSLMRGRLTRSKLTETSERIERTIKRSSK